MQFYLLSVLTTIAAGATLAADFVVQRFPVLEPLKRFAGNSRAKAALGLVTAGVGFLKLFARAPGEAFIIGDFIPAVAGMAVGGLLMLDQYRARDQIVSDEDALTRLDDSLKPYHTPLGLGGVVIGAAHFLLVQAPLL